MPTQVRIISQRNSASWDDLIRHLADNGAWEQQQTYFGCTTQDRAEKVRRALRTAARRLGHAIKAYWYECSGCANGGPDCRYHVSFTLYDIEAARAYKAASAQQQPR
jgi:hypothetical protein